MQLALEPGDALVLCLDGLTDVGRRLGRSSFDLHAALVGAQLRSSAELGVRLEQAADLS